MSIENITANILNDAKNTAENSIANAEFTKQDIINNAKREAEEIIKAEAEIALKEAESLKAEGYPLQSSKAGKCCYLRNRKLSTRALMLLWKCSGQ
jgi:vacuolar-type H+-ATPase subunit H